MDDAPPTLFLTRPDAQSREFLAECEASLGRRIPAVIAPLMRIEPVGDLPDLEGVATLVVTSSHAVRRLAEEGVLRGRSVACVGEATAALAQGFGAEAVCLGRDVAGFLDRADALVAPCLYLRGRHVRMDLAAELTARGIETGEAVIYDQVAQPMSRAGESLLSGTAPVIAPVFSARSAELLSRSAQISAPLTVIAMSEAVAAAWEGDGPLVVVQEPTSAAMCAAVAAAF